MDINYLLLLQSFRESTGAFLGPVMIWFSDLAISFFPAALVLMIYWAFDRKAGKKMLFGMSLGRFINGFLKLTFCVYRPWIRDSRIIPYGNSTTTATGYSFPSGHSTVSTVYYGPVGHWFKKRNIIITIILYVMIGCTMFSRNFLGVHTPQDVLVGFGSSVIMIIIGNFIEDWSDKDPKKRDVIILVAGMLVCIGSVIYYIVKPYPIDYTEDGSLLVDPVKMMTDSLGAVSYFGSYLICRFFERRGFDFDKEINWKDRFIVGAIALIPLIWWDSNIVKIFSTIDLKIVGIIIRPIGFMAYSTILVPIIMKMVKEKGLLNRQQIENN